MKTKWETIGTKKSLQSILTPDCILSIYEGKVGAIKKFFGVKPVDHFYFRYINSDINNAIEGDIFAIRSVLCQRFPNYKSDHGACKFAFGKSELVIDTNMIYLTYNQTLEGGFKKGIAI